MEVFLGGLREGFKEEGVCELTMEGCEDPCPSLMYVSLFRDLGGTDGLLGSQLSLCPLLWWEKESHAWGKGG